MKLRKQEIISKIENGATLIKKFDKMYGTYFIINDVDGRKLYNLHLGDCKSIVTKSQFVKTMLDSNTFQFSKI
jgi:hypothetical protein